MLSMDSGSILTYNPSTIRRERGKSQQVTANQPNPVSCGWIFAACVEKRSLIIKSHTITSTTSPDCTGITHLLHDNTASKVYTSHMFAVCLEFPVSAQLYITPRMSWSQKLGVCSLLTRDNYPCSWSHDVWRCKSELWVWWSRWCFLNN